MGGDGAYLLNPRYWAVAGALLMVASACTVLACRDSRHARSDSARQPAEESDEHAVQAGGDTEEREAEEEREQRRRAMAALASYQAPSCDAAIAKIEALIHRGDGRWEEREDNGALPDDLLALISEAELWRRQATELCSEHPQRQQFDELILLMEAIWRYPSTVSKTELDRRLGVLSKR